MVHVFDLSAAIKQAAADKPMMTTPALTIPGLVVHIDGDYAAYYCSGNEDVEPGRARRILLDKFSKIKHACGAESIVVHLTNRASKKGNRFIIATVKKYQDQRGGAKPKNWETLREFMEGYTGDSFRTKDWTEREADDGIAYVAAAAASVGAPLAISTADKDMRMLPGIHVVWKTNELVHVPLNAWEVIHDGKVYGHKWFWLQMLQGDTADNIPGLPKYVTPKGSSALLGPATAEKLLAAVKDNGQAAQVVSGLYRGWYDTEWADRLAEQAALLWLRTDREALPGDFLSLGVFGSEVSDAVSRMNERIAVRLKELEAMAQ